jgi:sulfur-carrier protein
MTTTTLTTIHVPSMLRASCGGAARLGMPGATVVEVFDELERRHPELHRCIRDETGAVRRHVGVFVNTSHIRDLEGLATRLEPGDTITILPAVSGG